MLTAAQLALIVSAIISNLNRPIVPGKFCIMDDLNTLQKQVTHITCLATGGREATHTQP